MATRFRLDDLYKMVAYIYREQNAQLIACIHVRALCGSLRNAYDP